MSSASRAGTHGKISIVTQLYASDRLERTSDMTNETDNRVLSRKGARILSDEELEMVTGANGTSMITGCFRCTADVKPD